MRLLGCQTRIYIITIMKTDINNYLLLQKINYSQRTMSGWNLKLIFWYGNVCTMNQEK